MPIDTMKLYHSPSSPNSRRVRVYLADKGLPVPLGPIDLAATEQGVDQAMAAH